MRAARSELDVVQQLVPVFGSVAFDRDAAPKRIKSILLTLSNLSQLDVNHALLASRNVVRFVCALVRHIGTRHMLCRTYAHTADELRLSLALLANVAHTVELPGRDEALTILHLLLAFAPCPAPDFARPPLMFANYEEPRHPYLPLAANCLAKLLAHDRPSGAVLKAVFLDDNNNNTAAAATTTIDTTTTSTDASPPSPPSSSYLSSPPLQITPKPPAAHPTQAPSAPPFELLTRTFALVILPVPVMGRGNHVLLVKPHMAQLMQSLRAAEHLITLLPNADAGAAVAHLWLASTDGFAANLMRLVCMVSTATARSLPRTSSSTTTGLSLLLPLRRQQQPQLLAAAAAALVEAPRLQRRQRRSCRRRPRWRWRRRSAICAAGAAS